MISKEKNYAFIDSQNVNLGVQELGWNKKAPPKDGTLRGTFRIDMLLL